MKRYNEMTDAELLELTDEQILKLVDYECALEGVPMLPPHPGVAPQKEMPEPDASVFEIAGFFTMDSDHAARILAAFNSGILFKESYANNDYNTKYLEPLTGDKYGKPKIETKTIHSPEQWDKIKDTVANFAGLKASYNAKLKEYDEAFKERKDISESVWNAVKDARDRDYEKSCLRSEFARYLELAEGDKKIAMNFLVKAKGSIEYNYKELVQELCPGYGELVNEVIEPEEPVND